MLVDPEVIILPHDSFESPELNIVITKMAVSSLLRTHFTGSIVTHSPVDLPLFKIARQGLVEKTYQLPEPRMPSDRSSGNSIRFLRDRPPGPAHKGDSHWVIITDPASLVLRNIDHLFPSVSSGAYAAEATDFLWLKVGRAQRTGIVFASRGIWAVRARYLKMVVERWGSKWETEQHRLTEDEVWSAVVSDLPLRKRCFEHEEVIAPPIDSIDWTAIGSAAFLTIPDWPDRQQQEFLQALYFGKFFGDETGLMINILDS